MLRNQKSLQPLVNKALRILGIRHLLLGIHDAAFPSLPGEDLGIGTPYSRGAEFFLQFARELGFNGIQLGPQGITSPGNPSPYDGTFFSRSPLLLAPLVLTESSYKLLNPGTLTMLAGNLPEDRTRVQRPYAESAVRRIMTEVSERFQEASLRPGKTTRAIQLSYAHFRRRNKAWIEDDALYDVLLSEYSGRSWSEWEGSAEAALDQSLLAPPPGSEQKAQYRINKLRQKHANAIETFCFTQYLIAEQHENLRRRCKNLNLKIFGDCQIGLSDRDAWASQAFLLPGYHLGAPPSRTNPDGQPWNYPVLDPRQYLFDNGRPGPVLLFLRARVDKLFREFDGLRLDHPHGLICPWVYRAGQKDSLHAVQTGARLFASPALPDHPELVPFAIVRPDQIDVSRHRYDDTWVIDLDTDQVRQYGLLFAEIVDSARSSRGGPREIACEILSTQPYPIKRVMAHYGQGRFRVTQKADLGNPDDVYRSENARPEDWLMLGNHDTSSIWTVASKWQASGEALQQAAYLATRLRIPDAERTAWMNRTAGDIGRLVQAKFADLFVGPAQNIMVYFTDLLGMQEAYNCPGSINDTNWSVRVDSSYEAIYQARLVKHCALNLPAALAMALRAQGNACLSRHHDLILSLEAKTVVPTG